MNDRNKFLILSVSMLVISTFVTACAKPTSFTLPPVKQTAAAMETGTQAVLAITATESASCPRPTPDIIGVVPSCDIQMPFGDHRGITSQANAISPSGIMYWIWVGTPDDNPDQGLIRVMKIFIDPCVGHKQGVENTDTTLTDYSAPKGPLTIIKIDGDTIIYDIAGGGSGSFNFVTGQFMP